MTATADACETAPSGGGRVPALVPGPFLALLGLLAATAGAAPTELRVGVISSPPLIESAPDGGVRGFYPEVLQALADRQGWQLRWVTGPREQLLRGIATGSIDLLPGAVSGGMVSEVAQLGSESLIDVRARIFASPGAGIRGFDDLSGRRIAVVASGVSDQLFLQAADALGWDITIREYPSGHGALQAVQRGQADAALVGNLFGDHVAGNYGLEPTLVYLRPEPRYMAYPRNRLRAERETIEATLVAWKEDAASPYWSAFRRWTEEAVSGPASIPLSAGERRWIAANPVMRVAFDAEFPPFSFRDADGRAAGLAVDTLKALADILGMRLETTVLSHWEDVYRAGVEREVDVVATMVDRPQRRELFLFTTPFIQKTLVIVTRDNDQRVSQLRDLAGLKVALVRNYQHTDVILREVPDIVPLYQPTMLDALNAVATGAADATVSFYAAVSYYRVHLGMSSLRFAAVLDRSAAAESIAVRRDRPELAALLDKALQLMPLAQEQAIRMRWITPEAREQEGARVQLTPAEREWLLDHPVIRLGFDADFRPFEMLDEQGRLGGIAADYVRLLNERLGTNLQPVTGLTWTEVLDRMQRREIDVVSAVVATNDRREFMDFSVPYEKRRRVIVTRSNSPLVEGVDSLLGWRVAVTAGTSHVSYVTDYTRLTPILYQDNASQFEDLASGKVDAVVSTVGTASYWIRTLGLPNLKIAAPVNDDPLRFGIRSDWPILTRIINKGLATITDAERRDIAQRWIGLEYEQDFTRTPLFRNLMAAVAVLTILALAAGAWSTSLRERVRARTAELRGLTRRLADAQEAERRHIVRELHDSVSQNLTGLGYTLHVAHDHLSAGKPEDAIESMQTAIKVNQEAMAELRALMSDLRPPVLDHLGLAEALRWFGNEFEKRSGIEVVVDLDVADPARLEASATHLFRIVQEALSNAARHGGARSAFVTLVQDAGGIQLTVEDDGAGFDTRATGKDSWGLLNMRERASAVGGTLKLRSKAGRGTRVEVRIAS